MRVKYALIFSCIFAFLGCKKEYNCSCTIVDVGSYFATSSNQNFTKKMTKKQATAACKEIENSLKENYSQHCTACSTTVVCKLK